MEQVSKLLDEYVYNPPNMPENSSYLRLSDVINFMKGITPVVIIVFIALYNQWSNYTVWIYLGTHGTYGLLWVGKDYFGFGDARWQGRKGWFTVSSTFLALLLYWMPIKLICQNSTRVPPFVAFLSVFMFSVGVFFHYGSDLHKCAFIEYRTQIKKLNDKATPNVLTTKFWALSRNINYFGELLIYCSFCILSLNLLPFLWLFGMITMYWLPSMYKKENSLSRFGKEWEDYKKKSFFFIPYIW
ncbi:hypothetical protein MIR68_006777 [Amoeboaphelidium protococcarum]|nr:hypothetical protein MIR68_006777 [Amoeboaphelidium protococcarum]